MDDEYEALIEKKVWDVVLLPPVTNTGEVVHTYTAV